MYTHHFAQKEEGRRDPTVEESSLFVRSFDHYYSIISFHDYFFIRL